MIRISAILLAAGLSQRMGSYKLMLEYQGKPILQHSIDLLNELPVYERILVTSEVRVNRVVIYPNIVRVINTQPEKGLSTSIKLGVEAATGTHLLFLSADQPKLKVTDMKPILEAANSDPDKIIYPLIDSKPDSPTLFPGSFRMELLNLYKTSQKDQNDAGGRIIRDANKHLCLPFEPEKPMNFNDIDTPDDLKML